MKNLNYLNNQLVDYGKLQVSIYEEDKDRVKPMSDINVKIISKYDYTVIDELVTNSLGQTDTIELLAPPLEYSLSYEGGKPYREYNLFISADGFESVNIQGVQILPDSKALQVVHLKPIEDINYGTRTIPIFQHTLWGNYQSKILEAEVKPRLDLGGGIDLQEPAIPEYVIVHLGVPTDTSVRDVRVTFKEYIKNVASSEIYATWPREAIKANILTIVSFVLNRYYTKWYSRKGYKFTISNSTAFDQAFFYGRNIFETISNIVDEIFETYITKPEIKQPLLTQHYDGVRLKCEKGLSQWGSKKMGDEGYDFLNILKKYYGEDIYLKQAKKVEGVPIPYTGINVKEASFRNFHDK